MRRDDILWKTVLEDVFDDFLRFFIPDADRFLDLSRGVEYLDKELDQLFPPEEDEYKPRYVDKLAKVYTRSGAEEWILVHVEVQGYKDNHFAKRMFQYYTRIWDKYDRSVVAMAIFTDPEPGFHPKAFEQSFLGTSVCYTYNTYKVMDQPEATLAENPNPFAIVAWTVQAALKRSKITGQELYDLKLSIARRLVTRRIDKAKIGKIMDFLRYYVRFENAELGANFDREIAVITENSASMGIQEFLLHRAKKEGVQEGVQKGRELGRQESIHELIRNQLRKKQFTPGQIAEIFDQPLALVLALKTELERE